MCGELCHDIENKSHIEWGKIRCIRGRSCIMLRSSGENRPSCGIWRGTTSKRCAATCTVQKAGSIHGKRATRLMIRHGPRDGAPSLGTSRVKSLNGLNSASSSCAGRWDNAANTGVPRLSSRNSNSKASSRFPLCERSIAWCSAITRRTSHATQVLPSSLTSWYSYRGHEVIAGVNIVSTISPLRGHWHEHGKGWRKLGVSA